MKKATCIRYGDCGENKCCKECDKFHTCSTSCGVVPDLECKGMQYSINGVIVTKEQFDKTEENAQVSKKPKLVPMPGTEGNWGERHWGNKEKEDEDNG